MVNTEQIQSHFWRIFILLCFVSTFFSFLFILLYRSVLIYNLYVCVLTVFLWLWMWMFLHLYMFLCFFTGSYFSIYLLVLSYSDSFVLIFLIYYYIFILYFRCLQFVFQRERPREDVDLGGWGGGANLERVKGWWSNILYLKSLF